MFNDMFHRRKSLSTIMDMKSGKPRSRLWFWCFLCCSLWVVLLFVHFRVLGRDKSVEVVEAVEDSIRKLNNHVPSIKKPAPSSYLLSPPSNSKKMVPLKPPNSEIVGSQNTMILSPKPSDSISVPRNTKVVSPRTSKSKMVSENYEDLSPPAFMRAMRSAENKSDPCGGKYVYVHKLPPSYNVEMLKECRSLSLWTNMCKFTSNAGLGPPLDNSEGVFSHTGWFATNQFAVDVIFFNRMKQYECLTNDSSLASVVYVPFYAGLDISRHLWGYNISVRDAASLELMDWLVKQPEWKINNGHDHFLVGGRITWDFRRLSDEETDWGSKLLFLPAMKNMTMLVVEASPWNRNDMAIPYPTYFHPAKDLDIVEWQQRMHSMDRPYLFSFAGAPRPDMPKSIRGQIIEQCKNSKLGMLLECDFGESKCHSPSSIMNMFQHSAFCLQPQGDSYTRRSFFDSILAGCIPVTFHPGSAYAQYIWHLPRDYTTYSVFIPEDDIRKGNISIEQRLLQISPEKVRSMREEVIKLIPSLVYADPRSKLKNYKDAFDIAVESMIEKVTKLRNEILEGKEVEDYKEDVDGSEQGTRKWEGLRREGERTWDEFFSKPKNEIASSSP